MTATTYTATLNGTTYEHSSKAKKAPTHFVIVERHCGKGDYFAAYRSSLKAAQNEAKRCGARFTAGTVTVHVLPCVPA